MTKLVTDEAVERLLEIANRDEAKSVTVRTADLKAVLEQFAASAPVAPQGEWVTLTRPDIEAALRTAIAREREACAKIADTIERRQEDDLGAANSGGAGLCAFFIRARSEP